MVSNITARLNTIEEACRNNFGKFTVDFTSINASVEALQNEMLRHYTVVRRIETDQLSVASQSETSSQSHASSSVSKPELIFHHNL